MNQFKRYAENLTGVWNSFQQMAFERAGLKAVFDHVRNLVLATLIIAAGVHANVYAPDMPTLAIFELKSFGYGVAAVGLILAILNLLDGLHKLARTSTPILLRVLVIMLYLFFSVRRPSIDLSVPDIFDRLSAGNATLVSVRLTS